MAIAVSVGFRIARQGQPTATENVLPTVDPRHFSMNADLAWTDACANACSTGVSTQDWALLPDFRDRISQYDLEASGVCIVRQVTA